MKIRVKLRFDEATASPESLVDIAAALNRVADNQDKIAALLTENAALTADLPARIVAALDGSVTVEPT